MLTFLVGTQAIAVSITSLYVIQHLTNRYRSNLKLIYKCKQNGFKHYKYY